MGLNVILAAASGSTSATTKAGTVIVTQGWKVAAVFIGLGGVLLVYLLGAAVAGSLNPYTVFKRLIEGADGLASTSKFQWFLWLSAVVFVYVALYVVRAQSGDYSAISDIPANVMTVLGFSTGTMIIAKGIRTTSVNNGDSPNRAPTADSAGVAAGLFADDTGVPELAKVQMLVFTFIAIGIFVAGFFHQLAASSVSTALPTIDSSLLVLMGISQGGYLGKKLVTSGTPALYLIPNGYYTPGSNVTVSGFSLGDSQGGSALMLDGKQIPVNNSGWTSTAITFAVNAQQPDGTAWPPGQSKHKVSAIINGQETNQVNLTVGTFGLNPIDGGAVKPAASVTAQGAELGSGSGGDHLDMSGNQIPTTAWTNTAITFAVPVGGPNPGDANWPAGDTTVPIRAVVGGQLTNDVDLTVHP
jgi:hypothetical protein